MLPLLLAMAITVPEQTHTEADAVGWAFEALLKYEQEEWPNIRFVYVPAWGDAEWIGATNVAVNLAASHSRTLHPADVHAGGYLLAFNLSRLAPHPKQLKTLRATWDSLAINDPYFHVPAINQQKGGAVAILAPHLQQAVAVRAEQTKQTERLDVLLATMTGSPGVVYRADFLIEQLLTSLRGRYLDFRQIDLSKPAKGSTQFRREAAKYGFFPKESRLQQGEKGELMLIADVTGKSRVVQTIFGTASQQPLASTFDFADETTRPDEQFIRNVVSFDAFHDAGEHFVPMRNGLIEFILTDGDGNIQKAAPPEVVADHTKPNGHTKQLEAGMSCVVCHMTSGTGMYQTARNDMEFLLGADVDFFGDDFTLTDSDGKAVVLSRAEAVDLVAGRFGQRIDEPDGILGRARRDFARAIAVLTDYPIEADGPDAVYRAGIKIQQIYHGYRYAPVDAQRACQELGYKVDRPRALETFRRLAPAPAAGSEEDIVIAMVRAGAIIKRDDWEAIYAECAQRAAAVHAAKGK